MPTACWVEYSHTELMSMHGIELDDDFDTDEDHCEDDADMYQNTACNCSNCMECLGMSWRDFI